jgi:hypothetical protein
MTQEWLLSKCETLSSTTMPPKQKQNKSHTVQDIITHQELYLVVKKIQEWIHVTNWSYQSQKNSC